MTLSDCHAQEHDVSLNACPSTLSISIGMFAEDGSEQEPSEEEIFLEQLFSTAYPSDPFYPDDRRQAHQIRQRVANFLAEEEYLEELEAAQSAVKFPLDDDEVDEEEPDEDEILIQERNQRTVAWVREGLELAEEAPIPVSAYAETRALVTHQYIEFLRLSGQKEEA
jgi:hypothetical protein